jgi:hypothetical protein
MFAYTLIGAVAAASAYSYVHGQMSEAEYVTSQVDGRDYLVQKNSSSQEAANALGKINSDVSALVRHLLAKFPDDPRVVRISQRYDPSAISEGSATSGFTSYSVNKGERLVLCLRQDDDAQSFASPNVVMYVTIHELAHLGTKEIGHPPPFWDCFKFLLEQAIAIGIYTREDYAKNPQKFCGIVVDSSII